MNITLVISSLDAGGAERVLVTIANYWAHQGQQVTLLTLDDGCRPPFYEVCPMVRRQALGLARESANLVQGISNNLYRVRVVRAAIKASRADVVVSFMDHTNVLTMLATRGQHVPVIVAERVDPHHQPIGRVRERLRYWLYPQAFAVVVQTAAALEYFPVKVRQRGWVIPNPIALPSGVATVSQPSDRCTIEKTIIAMGRLTEQKGFDILLRAFARVAPRHPQWSLVIWGDGPLRGALQDLCAELELGGRASLAGRTTQPFVKMRQADMFVLSSRYEGFPNVLLEAMACGVPVISFDCASGPGAIIRDGVDGILVPAGSVHALAAAMDRLMSNEVERQTLGSQAPAVLERFGLQTIMRTWDGLITEAADGGSFN